MPLNVQTPSAEAPRTLPYFVETMGDEESAAESTRARGEASAAAAPAREFLISSRRRIMKPPFGTSGAKALLAFAGFMSQPKLPPTRPFEPAAAASTLGCAGRFRNTPAGGRWLGDLRLGHSDGNVLARCGHGGEDNGDDSHACEHRVQLERLRIASVAIEDYAANQPGRRRNS